jgi:hypothetical protein
LRVYGRAGEKKRVFMEGPLVIFLLVTRLSEGVGEPLKTLIETVTGGGTGGLDVLLVKESKRSACEQRDTIWGLILIALYLPRRVVADCGGQACL